MTIFLHYAMKNKLPGESIGFPLTITLGMPSTSSTLWLYGSVCPKALNQYLNAAAWPLITGGLRPRQRSVPNRFPFVSLIISKRKVENKKYQLKAAQMCIKIVIYYKLTTIHKPLRFQLKDLAAIYLLLLATVLHHLITPLNNLTENIVMIKANILQKKIFLH